MLALLLLILLSPQGAAALPPVCQELGIPNPASPNCSLKRNKTCSRASRVVAAHYYYSYDYGDKYAETGFTHKPQSWERFSYRRSKWHEDNLRDMLSSGISVAAVDWSLEPEIVFPESGGQGESEDGGDSAPWQYEGLRMLVKGYGDLTCAGRKPPALAPYFSTITVDGDQNPLTPNGYNLRTKNALNYVFRSLSAFFCYVPAEALATFEGRPIVFMGPLAGASEVESNFFEQLSASFRAQFEVDLFIVKQRENIDLVAKIDPQALNLAQQLYEEKVKYDDVLLQLLASDEFYLRSGAVDEYFLQNVQWKLFERNDSVESLLEPWTQWLSRAARLKQLEQFVRKRQQEYYAAMVARWYKQFTNQPEDFAALFEGITKGSSSIEEVETWLGMLERGVHYDAVRVEILASELFYKLAGHSPEIFIRRLYETLYYRCPSSEDLALWNEVIEAENKRRKRELSIELRREIATRFVASREAKRIDVFWLFSHLLYRTPGWPGFADAVFSSEGSLCQEYANVASLGPGYDDENIPGLSQHTQIPRREGSYYAEAWRRVLKMKPKPFMVFLQSWNNFHNATELARSREFGRDFISLTRRYTEAYKDTGFIAGEGRCP